MSAQKGLNGTEGLINNMNSLVSYHTELSDHFILSSSGKELLAKDKSVSVVWSVWVRRHFTAGVPPSHHHLLPPPQHPHISLLYGNTGWKKT